MGDILRSKFEYRGLSIEHLSHAAFKITDGKIAVYIDPFEVKEKRGDADIIICTHDHYDHCSLEDIEKLAKTGTVIVAAVNCRSKLVGIPFEKRFIAPGEKVEVLGVLIEAVPAYNIGKRFHPKNYQGIGVILTIGGVSIYHAGDTDFIPEMEKLENIDIALLPVSGTYVMDWKEAVKAAEAIKPKVAIPMHYGSIVGSLKDAEYFKEQVSKICEVVII